jgi:hypothetical protein
MGGECDKQAIIDDLESKEELDPDKHDGCYRLMRETVAAYARLGDLSIVDYRDLNLLRLTTVLTLRHGIESKKTAMGSSVRRGCCWPTSRECVRRPTIARTSGGLPPTAESLTILRRLLMR